jgi:hypothetical protein
MKFLVLMALVSTSVFAQNATTTNNQAANLEQVKQMQLAHMDKRIAIIQEGKTCVQSATTRDAVKACHQQMKQKREALKGEMKSTREQWKAQKKANRQKQ